MITDPARALAIIGALVITLRAIDYIILLVAPIVKKAADRITAATAKTRRKAGAVWQAIKEG